MQSLGVLLNINLRTAPGDDEVEVPESDVAETSRKQPEVEKKREPEPEPEPEPEVVEEKEKKERKEKAKKEKELGNAAYKKKDFETAIQHYSTLVSMALKSAKQ